MTRAEEILQRLKLFGVRLGLETTRAILSELGDPQRALPAVLVAGTNGKGSTAALLSAIAFAAGYRTGLYTSPHLEAVEERIRIDGAAISGERLAGLLETTVAAAQRATGDLPTYFEALTVAALVELAERQVELGVLEVGMGGRLDATNVSQPVLSVITPIGLDHVEHLGDSLAAIAAEKAGVMRRDRPVLVDPGSSEAAAALARAAESGGSTLVGAGTAGRLGFLPARSPRRQRLAVTTRHGRYTLETTLLGEHQRGNVRLAVLAAEALAEAGWERIGRAAIERGVAICRWPGRLEEVDLGDGRRVLLDGGHNPAGLRALAAALDRLGEPFDLLYASFDDKPAAEMLPPLAARARRVVLTTAEGRSPWPVEALAALLDRDAVLEAEPSAALTAALGESPARGGSSLLVVTGSLYLVGDVRRRLRERFGRPAPATDPLYSG